MVSRYWHICLFSLATVHVHTADAVVVDFPDPALETAVREHLIALGADPGAEIEDTELVGVGFTHLEVVWNSNDDPRITDLTGIEFATDLEVLNIAGNGAMDYAPLSALVNLRELDIERSVNGDLSPLSGLTELRRLNAESILFGVVLSDVSPLSGLVNLEVLNLRMNSISDVSPLASLSNLVELDLKDNPISDIGPLTGLSNLRTLILHATDIVTLPPLGELTNLEFLDVQFTDLIDVGPIGELTSLRNLNMELIDATDFSPLAPLTNLRILDISATGVDDLSFMANFTELTDFFAPFTNVSEISPLSGLHKLKRISLSRTAVSDIAPLSGLTSLDTLSFGDTNVSDLSPLVANPGLGPSNRPGGDVIGFPNCPLTQNAVCFQVPLLEARGVFVEITQTCDGVQGVSYFQFEGTRFELPIQGPVDLSRPIQWMHDFKPLANTGRVSGVTEPTLVIDPLVLSDSGIYSASYDNGTKASDTFGPIGIKVVPLGSLPAAGSLALFLLVAGVSVIALRGLSREN